MYSGEIIKEPTILFSHTMATHLGKEKNEIFYLLVFECAAVVPDTDNPPHIEYQVLPGSVVGMEVNFTEGSIVPYYFDSVFRTVKDCLPLNMDNLMKELKANTEGKSLALLSNICRLIIDFDCRERKNGV